MAFGIDRLGRTAAACAAALVLAGADAPAAEDVTSWDGNARSAVRMFAGVRAPAGAHLRAGVEIRLLRGWHTYWRYPGDAGMPPQFAFEGSRNVKQIDVLWPAPERMTDPGGTSIGYLADVIFPLRVLALDGGQPVTLRLRINYAICEKSCVPADGRSELTLAGGRSSLDAALRAAEARVPKPQTLGQDPSFSIRSVYREPSPGAGRVVVDVVGPPGVDLFAEGPTPQWALPVPSRIGGAPPGVHRFAFELDGAPTGVRYEGALITLTAVAPGRAIEVTTRLD